MESVLVFSKDFFYFRSDVIKKKGIIYLGCNSSKGKATRQKDRLQKWKVHFQKHLGNPPKIIEYYTQKIVDKQQDIKLGDFTTDKINQALKKLKGRKAAGLDGIPPEVMEDRKV